MKFTCNNCGFSASIPTEQTSCPMCGSTNISLLAESGQPPIDTPLDDEPDIPPLAPPNPTPQPMQVESIPKQPVSAQPTDSNEDDELVQMLQEIEEEQSEKLVLNPEAHTSNTKLYAIIAVAVLIVVGIAIFFIMQSSNTATQKEENEHIEKEQTEALQQKKNEQNMKEEILKEEKKIEKEMNEEVAAVEEEEQNIEQQKTDPTPKTQQPVKRKTKPKRKHVYKKRRHTAPHRKAQPVKKEVPAPLTPQPTPAKTTPAPIAPAPTPVKSAPVIAKKPTFMDLINLGKIALSQKKYKDAIIFFTQAKQINPGIASIYKYLGIAYASQGKTSKACAQYRQYILLAPNAKDKPQIEQALQGCQ